MDFRSVISPVSLLRLTSEPNFELYAPMMLTLLMDSFSKKVVTKTHEGNQ